MKDAQETTLKANIAVKSDIMRMAEKAAVEVAKWSPSKREYARRIMETLS